MSAGGKYDGVAYNHHIWGEIIYATKEQLQSFEIGAGIAFPGEAGGPKRTLNVHDPRGLKVSIERATGDQFRASISFPGRKYEETQLFEFGPGVQCRPYTLGDEYTGAPEALSAAGLVRLDQLPGRPGMRKTTVTIMADGTLPEGAANNARRGQDKTGEKVITRAGKGVYSVSRCIETAAQQNLGYLT